MERERWRDGGERVEGAWARRRETETVRDRNRRGHERERERGRLNSFDRRAEPGGTVLLWE